MQNRIVQKADRMDSNSNSKKRERSPDFAQISSSEESDGWLGEEDRFENSVNSSDAGSPDINLKPKQRS